MPCSQVAPGSLVRGYAAVQYHLGGNDYRFDVVQIYFFE